LGYLEIYQTTNSKQEAIERVKDKTIIITNKVIIDKEVMDNAPYLKLYALLQPGITT
jgi:hypothetical protein